MGIRGAVGRVGVWMMSWTLLLPCQSSAVFKTIIILDCPRRVEVEQVWERQRTVVSKGMPCR